MNNPNTFVVVGVMIIVASGYEVLHKPEVKKPVMLIGPECYNLGKVIGQLTERAGQYRTLKYPVPKEVQRLIDDGPSDGCKYLGTKQWK